MEKVSLLRRSCRHREMTFVHREMTFVHREMNSVHRELTLCTGDCSAQGLREMTLMHGEMTIVHKEVTLVHREVTLVNLESGDDCITPRDANRAQGNDFNAHFIGHSP